MVTFNIVDITLTIVTVVFLVSLAIFFVRQNQIADKLTTNTFIRTWKCANIPPRQGGRYWCVVEEQNDLGYSTYQWNCSWNPNDNTWSNNQGNVHVIYYTELGPTLN